MAFSVITLFAFLGLAKAYWTIDASTNCPQYTEGSINQAKYPNTCVLYDGNYTIDTSVCEGNEICYYTGISGINPQMNAKCQQKPSPPDPSESGRFPGEKCDTSNDCDSTYAPNGCQNGICKGFPKDQNFTRDNPNFACDPGLFYEFYENSTLGRCVDQLSDGASCTESYQCPNSHVCVNSVCTEVGSVKNGTTIKFTDLPFSNYACDHFAYSAIGNETFTCIAPVTLAGQAAKCTTNSDCAASNNNAGTCTCGLSGDSFCLLQIGDLLYDKPNNYLKDWLKGDAKKCNTARRLSRPCQRDYWENYDEYQYYRYQASVYPWFKNAKDEFVKIFQYEYYKLEHTLWANETLKDAKLQWQVLTDRVTFNLTVDSGVVSNYDWYGVALKESSDKLSMIDGDYVVVMLKNQSLFHMNTFGYSSNGRPQNDTAPVFIKNSSHVLGNGNLLVSWTRELGIRIPNQTLELKSGANYTLLYAFGKVEKGVLEKHEKNNRGYGSILLSSDFSGKGKIPDDDSALSTFSLLALLLLQVAF